MDLPGALSSDAAIKHLPSPAPSIKAFSVSAGLGAGVSVPAGTRASDEEENARASLGLS